MKILLYSVNAMMKLVNFGAELDLIRAHLDEGDEVYVLRCQGELESCHTNTHHFKHKCYQCRQRFNKGIALTGLEDSYLLDLTLEGVDYSRLPQHFSSLEALADFSIDGVNLGQPTVASVVMELKDHKFDVAAHRERILQKLRMAYLVHVNIRRALDQIQPDAVYTFNGRLAETRPVVNNCLQAGITVYSIDRAGTQGRYALYENSTAIGLATWRDMFLDLWKTETGDKEALATEFYTVRRQGKDTGDPSFTKKQQQNLLPEGFDHQQKNIALYIGSEYEFAGDPERKNRLYKDQNDGILRIAEDLAAYPEFKVWVRAHPHITFVENLQLKELQELEARNYPNLGIIWPSNPVDTYALMDHCDKIITFGSTVGIEATFWGRPSILAGRGFYEDLGATYNPLSHEEMMRLLLTDHLPVADRTGALIYGHGMMTNGRPYRYFTQTSVFDGHFSGNTLEPDLHEKLVAYVLRKLDKRRYKRRESQKALQRH
ncbi:MAG TPA: hypothetical protein V6C52_14025 [Coleofasciculaceae cyanobacterium]|jgi:hypothetical protein